MVAVRRVGAATTHSQPPSPSSGSAPWACPGQAFLAAGHPTTVWNRSPGRAEPLATPGRPSPRTCPPPSIPRPHSSSVLLDTPAVDAVLDAGGRRAGGDPRSSTSPPRPRRTRRALGARVPRLEPAYLDGRSWSPRTMVGTADGLVLYSGDTHASPSTGDTLAALGGAELLGADPGLAAAYDLGMLDVFFTGMAAFLHAAAWSAPTASQPEPSCPTRSACSTCWTTRSTASPPMSTVASTSAPRTTLSWSSPCSTTSSPRVGLVASTPSARRSARPCPRHRRRRTEPTASAHHRRHPGLRTGRTRRRRIAPSSRRWPARRRRSSAGDRPISRRMIIGLGKTSRILEVRGPGLPLATASTQRDACCGTRSAAPRCWRSGGPAGMSSATHVSGLVWSHLI